MADLTPNPVWKNVYQLETTDPVLAGAGGISNRQGQELTDRTAYLKKTIEELTSYSGDWDSLTTGGNYWGVGTDANSPGGTNRYHIQVLQDVTNTERTQIAIDTVTKDVYVRTYTSATWAAWSKVTDSAIVGVEVTKAATIATSTTKTKVTGFTEVLDRGSQWDNGASEFTCDSAGEYNVVINARMNVNSTGGAIVSIDVDTGGGFNEIASTLVNTVTMQIKTSAAANVFLSVGDKIRFATQKLGTGTQDVLEIQASISKVSN